MHANNNVIDRLAVGLDKYLTPIARKVASLKYLQAIAQTMASILPITVVGGFACLFAYLDVGFWTEFLTNFPAVQTMFMTIQSLTLSIVTLYVVIILPYRFCQQLGVENGLGAIIINLASFLLITPTVLYQNIPCEWLGHKGMFTALIMTYVVVRIYALFFKAGLLIKMPDSVPDFVSDSISSLIPGLVIVPVFAAFGAVLSTTSFGSLHQLIYTLIQTPLQNTGSSFPSYMLYCLAGPVSFFFGIHGQSTTVPWKTLALANNVEVIEALAAGATQNEGKLIFNSGTFASAAMGGIGMTLAAVIVACFFMRSKRMKTIGRIALVPQIFNISEPILFGLPIVLNPLLLIPTFLTGMVNGVISWVTCASGFVVYTGIDPSWTIPMILKSFFISATPLTCALVQIIILAFDIVIWFPFMKVLDKQYLEEESKEELSGEAE